MRIYRIDYQDRNLGSCVEWAGTKAEAAAFVRALRKDGYEPVVGPENFPTDKAGVLAWLNHWHTTENG